jgi:voltage-gated potassium channel
MGTRIRRLKASWRDTWLLLGEFRNPLLVFLLAVIGGGFIYFELARFTGEALSNRLEAIYLVLTMVFLQPSGAFPHNLVLELFYFVMPVIGIGALAQGLAEFGILLFNRRARTKEWEMAVASTFSQHTVLIGLGHLGFRVVQKLQAIGAQIVIIELSPKADLIASAQNMGIPVIQDDAARQSALEAAGIQRAHTVVLCTQNDALNLQIAVKARSLNPEIQVVIRIFDEDFAQSLQSQFGFTALSATSMAAPAFAAAAAGADITRPITVEGQPFSLARLKVSPGSKLVGVSVSDVEQNYDVSVVLLRNGADTDFHPSGTRSLAANDTMAVLGAPEQINLVVHDS